MELAGKHHYHLLTPSLKLDHQNFSNNYPFNERLPLSSWTKPSVAICNEGSYSNAEIFSHAYQSLGIGSLVGVPTFGAVISTGSKRLIDGSSVRMPFRGWYVKNSGENMDFKGAHLFRHTLATNMLRGGATISEIGEILRHQDSSSTEIYAKVDIKALHAIALPWPGGDV